MKTIENLNIHQIEDMMSCLHSVYLGVFAAMLRANQTCADAVRAAEAARKIAYKAEGTPFMLNMNSEWIPATNNSGKMIHLTKSGKRIEFGIDKDWDKCYINYDALTSVSEEFEEISFK